MQVPPIEALFRFLDLPRKTEQRHLQHQKSSQHSQKEFEEKLCIAIAQREPSNDVVYTADGKLKAL